MSMYRLNPIRSSFLIPAIILILIFVVYPIFATIMLSFNVNVVPGVNIVNRTSGLENYYKVVTDKRFINLEGIKTHTFPMGAIVHNIIWLVIHLPLTLIIGILFAVYLQYIKGGSIIRSFVFIGMVIPMIVGGLLISFSFDKDLGVVNILLKAIGLGSFVRTWTIYPDTALFSLILGSVWLWSGFTVTMYSAGLSSIPREVIEAAIVDGADFKTILFKVIIPLLRPVTLTVVAMTILWDLKIFDIVYAATQGGPGGASTVLALLMWEYFARLGDYAMSATVATILTIIIIPVVILWIKATLQGERT
ncbi:carbohydrate ABC transporter permease [Staphylothermus hellenicus]|uniref:Binding-protein-dependent transport systems inner membrane component n=1 Tax=Staphylothermus hellenicus (strain DSM 12710 / JCM 10830 / BK20S6-10-b1 / P8) TaxID=591019 RepID=D7DCF3_STAHD|nr:sugar ABC transporter permease [Staphylothermus hellenicus]ADI31850.1 binding-protein-dependent transport systems inner membrane component [Staphylothermus hellenicus DSM 12710]